MVIRYSKEEIVDDKKSLFLAGPVPRDEYTSSWRKEALKILNKLNFQGVVYVPEVRDELYSTSYEEADMIWEREALKKSSVIVFWIPREFPNTLGLTTNVEFGYWIHSKKIIYGRPEKAFETKYLDWLYRNEIKKEPCNKLEKLLKDAIKIVNSK